MIIQTPNRGNIENKTNCVTHIPQNIKLTLANGVLTLKAGSKVYIPDGFENDGVTKKFEEIIITEDLVNSDFGSSTTIPDLWFYSITFNSLSGWGTNSCLSGSDLSSVPSTTTWAVYYDTSVNKILYRAGDTTWQDRKYSIPICLAYNTGTPENDKILTVFNGASYIGKHVFGLPGVRGLTPYGFNPDGSTRNEEVVVDNVIVGELSTAWTTIFSGHKFFFNAFFNKQYEILVDTRLTYNEHSAANFTGISFDPAENRWVSYVNGVSQGDAPYRFITIATFTGTITDTDASISGFVPEKVFEEKPQENLQQDYSLGEVYTGKHWIDGKKIYRKVISTTLTTYVDNTLRRRFSHSNVLSNVDHVVSVDGYYKMNNGTSSGYSFWIADAEIDENAAPMRGFSVPLVNGGVTYYIDIRVSYSCTSITTHIIFEYTKTTD